MKKLGIPNEKLRKAFKIFYFNCTKNSLPRQYPLQDSPAEISIMTAETNKEEKLKFLAASPNRTNPSKSTLPPKPHPDTHPSA